MRDSRASVFAAADSFYRPPRVCVLLVTDETCRRQSEPAPGLALFGSRRTATRAGNVIQTQPDRRGRCDVHNAIQEARLLLLRQ